MTEPIYLRYGRTLIQHTNIPNSVDFTWSTWSPGLYLSQDGKHYIRIKPMAKGYQGFIALEQDEETGLYDITHQEKWKGCTTESELQIADLLYTELGGRLKKAVQIAGISKK